MEDLEARKLHQILTGSVVQLKSSDECRRQEMDVDPSYASAAQLAVADKRNDISVRDNRCLIHALVLGQQRLAAAFLSKEELTETKSWPLTSSRPRSSSRLLAYGARFDRNRTQTDISTRTLMLRNAAPRKTAVGGCREHLAPTRGEREGARRRHDGSAPRARA